MSEVEATTGSTDFRPLEFSDTSEAVIKAGSTCSAPINVQKHQHQASLDLKCHTNATLPHQDHHAGFRARVPKPRFGVSGTQELLGPCAVSLHHTHTASTKSILGVHSGCW